MWQAALGMHSTMHSRVHTSHQLISIDIVFVVHDSEWCGSCVVTNCTATQQPQPQVASHQKVFTPHTDVVQVFTELNLSA
jgi:hypothetical protein